MNGLARAVFLDRDGTLIDDVGYLRDPNSVRVLPSVGEALRTLAKHGFKLFVISNQSGIGRGLISASEAHETHGRFVDLLAAERVRIDGAFYCPHAPDVGCDCRKPSPGLLLRAAKEFEVDLVNSFMVGDSARDVEAGKRAGCRTVLLATVDIPMHTDAKPDLVTADWDVVTKWILETAKVE